MSVNSMEETNQQLLLEILNKLNNLELLIPSEVSLSDLANSCNKENNTVRKYIIANYEPEKDFYKKGGKIFVGKEVAFDVRKHYVKG
ncbi:MAG: hypothetical protein PHV52_00290 [Aliarcobacter sp.]|nr:hypothetical protein [Aliarcobacter sp.]